MKLFVSRSQDEKKGFFGGSKGMSFVLSCRIELTPEETDLVEKYKQWALPVYTFQSEKGQGVIWTLSGMREGRTVTCDGVAELLDGENQVKNACENIKVLLAVMSTFGGEEVFEY